MLGGRDEDRGGDGRDDAAAEVMTALVSAQLRDARAGVFRAYVRARERARALAEEGVAKSEHGTPSRRPPDDP